MTKYRLFHRLLWQNNYLKQPLLILKQLSVSYLPHTELTNVADARRWLVKRNRCNLSAPNKSCTSSSYNAILLSNNDLVQWHHTNSELPEPVDYVWNLVDGKFKPVMTSLPPAPHAVIIWWSMAVPSRGAPTTYANAKRINWSVQVKKSRFLSTVFCRQFRRLEQSASSGLLLLWSSSWVTGKFSTTSGAKSLFDVNFLLDYWIIDVT